MWQEPQFDNHQFDRRAKAVTAETEISFQDLGSMHVTKRTQGFGGGRRLPTPAWAANDQQVRQIVLRYAEDRYYIRDHSGTDAERMARIKAAEQKKTPALKEHLEELLVAYNKNPQEHFSIQVQNIDTQILILERGVVALTTAAIYRYYRQGHNSVQIGEEFGFKSPMVRKWLFGLNTVANRLGLQRGPAVRNSNHTSYYRRPPKQSIHYGGKQEALRLFALRAVGATWKQCSAALKLTHPIAARFAWVHHFGDLVVSPPSVNDRKVRIAVKLPKEVGATPNQIRRVNRLRTLFILRTSGLTWEQCGQKLGIGGCAAMHIWKKYFGNLNVARQGKCKPGTGKKHVPGRMRGKDKQPRDRQNYTGRPGPTVWTPDRVATLKALRESGKTFQACADAMGLSRPQDVRWAYARYVLGKK